MMEARDHDKAQILKSLDVALRVLELFSGERPERGVTDIAAQIGVSKASIYRVLATLERRRFVVQNPSSGRYRLGPRLGQIGQLSLAGLNLPVEARPFMEELRDYTGEEVHLAILDGGEAIYIAKVEGMQPVQVVSRIGDRSPAHCVSTGKMLLAYAGERAIEGMLEGGLVCYTDRTHATPGSLLGELEDIRRKGYAVNWGEWRNEVRGVAAPILDSTHQVVASMGICSPASRLDEEAVAKYAPKVVEVAGRLSAHLGASVEMEASVG
ncbi:MAG: IclR family transcriptional regulator [Rubrobacteraceae bacterium]